MAILIHIHIINVSDLLLRRRTKVFIARPLIDDKIDLSNDCVSWDALMGLMLSTILVQVFISVTHEVLET